MELLSNTAVIGDLGITSAAVSTVYETLQVLAVLSNVSVPSSHMGFEGTCRINQELALKDD